MDILAGVVHWIHLLAAVMWIGSLSFVVMTLHPALKEKFPKESIKNLSKELQRRYFRITGALLVLIVITGGLNVRFARQAMEGSLPQTFLLFLGLKLTLVTGLISIFLLNILYRNEPLVENQTEIPWAKPSFVLGVFILLLAALLSHIHSH
jgi:uncharacterized membrane protein